MERRAQVLRNKVKEGGNNRLSLGDVERRSEEEEERKVRSVLSRHLSPRICARAPVLIRIIVQLLARVLL